MPQASNNNQVNPLFYRRYYYIGHIAKDCISVNSVFIYVHVILIDDVEYLIIVINHGNHNIQVYDTIINMKKMLLHRQIIYDIKNIYKHQRFFKMRLFKK